MCVLDCLEQKQTNKQNKTKKKQSHGPLQNSLDMHELQPTVTWETWWCVGYLVTVAAQSFSTKNPPFKSVYYSLSRKLLKDAGIPAICCVDYICVYGDLYVGHPPHTLLNTFIPIPTHTKRGKIGLCLIPSKSHADDPLSSLPLHLSPKKKEWWMRLRTSRFFTNMIQDLRLKNNNNDNWGEVWSPL